MSEPRVIALVSTCRRAALLTRLLDSLAVSREPVRRVYITDTAGEPAVAALAAAHAAAVPYDYAALPGAPGPGAGQAHGLTRALRAEDWTHALLIDDDAMVLPDTLTHLLAGLDRAGAGLAVPLITNERGHIGWFPGVHDRAAWRCLLRNELTPAAYRMVCGETPQPFRWAPWGVLLVARPTLAAAGLPSSDYGFEAEDLDYVLRLLLQAPGVLAPAAEARHWPPAQTEAAERLYVRGCLALQNVSYLALRTPHGRVLRRHLPGHVRRQLRRGSWRLSVWRDALAALWLGAVRARPAGRAGGDRFLRALRAGEARA